MKYFFLVEIRLDNFHIARKKKCFMLLVDYFRLLNNSGASCSYQLVGYLLSGMKSELTTSDGTSLAIILGRGRCVSQHSLSLASFSKPFQEK